MPSQYASYDASYPQRTPYLSATEYYNAPTAVDTSNLIAGGSAQAQLTALVETIGRASSWIDQFTCGSWGSLCATQNAENGRIWGSRDGTLRVHPKYWPILSVDAFSYSPLGNSAFGVTGLTSGAASIDPSNNVWIEPQEFIVSPQGTLGFGLSGAWGVVTSEYTCTWTYTNGWINTSFAASVTAGDDSIIPTSVLGIYPGTPFTLYDMPYDEQFMVDSSYVPGDAVVPLTAPAQFDHATLTSTISNLPPAIKQAAILATTAFIKQRGSGALIVSDMGATTDIQQGSGAQESGGDMTQAKMLLTPFKQQMVGY